MRIVPASHALKGCLTALGAADAMARGVPCIASTGGIGDGVESPHAPGIRAV